MSEDRENESKNILGMLVLVLPIFALMVFGWLNSPMLEEVKAEERLAALEYLARARYSTDTTERQAMIRYYGFTDDEVNPSLAHYNQNPGGDK